MLNWVRGQVSRKKRRYVEDRFDLDLSYIGDRIIAMGYPAQGFESLYRNDFADVKDFLDEKHGDNYMVYNLCSERDYDKEVFHCRVEKYPFDDHNPPKFDMIRQFCVHATEWLEQDPNHIVVVHCKAGKGRTGVMICALMLHMGQFQTCAESLQFYGEKRTMNEKGVTIPSQRRYVYFYEQFLQSGISRTVEFVPKPCVVTRVVFKNVPAKFFSRQLVIQVSDIDENIIYEGLGTNPKGPKKHRSDSILDFKLDGLITEPLVGDFRIAALKGKKEAWWMWFNSDFIKDQEEFETENIDKANKNKHFTPDFRMRVYAHH